MLFERTAISKKPEETIAQELQLMRQEGHLSPDMAFRDPYLLNFLGLADSYSEKDLESAILAELQHFIIELGNDFAFMARQKRITIDGSGNAVAVWLDTDGVVGDLVWSRYDATVGTWSAHQLLAQGVGTQVDALSRDYNLALVMNAGGDAVVVWGQRGVNDGAVSDDVIFSRRLAAGSATWTTSERRSADNSGVRDSAENPRVAISSAGRIAVTWIEQPASASDYAVRGQILEGGAWQPAQAIMTSGNSIDSRGEYALAMDALGMPLAVWSEQPSGADPLVGAVWR